MVYYFFALDEDFLDSELAKKKRRLGLSVLI